jgi:rhamnosyltransferase
MRILGHIHTFNDADVIEQTVAALRRQTVPLDAILIVDNASTDDTVDRIASAPVAIIRNSKNLGTSGAVVVGFEYALANGFDWVWLFDADSVPHPDALENLLKAFHALSPAGREAVCFLACRVASGAEHPPMIFTESGTPVPADTAQPCSACDCALWSGSLYRMEAVRKIGLPQANYFADWGELEYGYRARESGFVSYVVQDSVLDHDIGGTPGISIRTRRFGPIAFRVFNTSPLRCYYFLRNAIIFWLYQNKRRRLRTVLRMLLVCANFVMSFAVHPITRRRQLTACLRGVWDGLTMRLERRY